ncbi:cardiolipin synthase [Aeromicrobium senzhongii]|uniref:Cardiolipin synthase n=1 Tax=Aeromicrobium senzhongii TaxID=2663859 RepID=A0ABX6SSK8_9ACTN|nr:cardiolipin synthase [Aeromicrobium senzhongii]MTB89150.1 cardiolipin synthase [Aeromicrobium senzhongii]QNL93582.1 cardiolipin synthase [Aeromicrobium senzhongii]
MDHAGTLLSLAAVAAHFAINIAAIGIIPEGRRPQTAMAWLILIAFAPFVGALAFLLFGSARIGHHRRRELTTANRVIARETEALTAPAPADAPDYVEPIVQLNHRLASMPLTAGNHVTLLPDYQESIDEMIAAIDEARERVHVEFYIMALDEMTTPFFDALDRATARGVVVRLLFDHLGTRRINGYRELKRRLAASDIDWHLMMPLLPLRGRFRRPDLRNHRKLLVVDDVVGFTGSLNLTHPSYGKPKNRRIGREWVELWCRLEGPVVATIDALFSADWALETGEVLDIATHEVEQTPHSPRDVVGVAVQLIPSGPGFEEENNLRLFTSLLYNARHRISLTSPYFVPDETLLYAVTTAAQRGVDIELFVSEQADQFMVGHAQASYYRELLEAGVRIWLYPAPLVLHAKHLSIDDDVAVLGTSNMDMRSFALNYEMTLMLPDASVVERIRQVEDAYRAKSRELTIEEWTRRPAHLRFVDNAMRLTATLQ